jgi:ATP-dependent helicase HrpB
MGLTALPIDSVLDELRTRLRAGSNAVLEAPPGAGKTTRVPLALLDEDWVRGRKILLLEPRRIAARAAARRMAQTLGEAAGATVGYRVRMDSKIGPATKIEVVTDGIFARRIQRDPALEDVAAVLFDEFHERGLESDMGLALALDAQANLRPDLRLLAMSATLDGVAVAKIMGNAPVVRAEGRMYPVGVEWQPRPDPRDMADAMARTISRALDRDTGDVLAFLPGVAEIRRVADRLAGLGAGIDLLPLYGDLAAEAQDRAIQPAVAGRRKIVLATAIAETSLTIDGVGIVVDCGFKRAPRFDPRSGMSRLETVRVSQASAEQRRGRAGRVAPGMCWRLWGEAEHRQLALFDRPEIAEADLAPLALELAAWGIGDPASLALLDPPPAAAFGQARGLLVELGAIDANARITAHGRAMAELAAHPRLAHMMLAAKRHGAGAMAAELAALIEERDILRGCREADLRLRLEILARDRDTRLPVGASLDKGAVARVREAARVWRKRLGVSVDTAAVSASAGAVLAYAYPDRIGKRRGGTAAGYLLANGRGAAFAAPESIAAEDWIVAADLDGTAREARIFSALPTTKSEIENQFSELIVAERIVAWQPREQAVSAVARRRLGAIVLDERPAKDASPAELLAAMLDGVREMGLVCLPWTKACENLRERVSFLRRVEGEIWPDLSDAALRASLGEWLGPSLDKATRASHLASIDLFAALQNALDWSMRKKLDTHAPTHWEVPTGNRLALDYSGEAPVLAVRLQEMFGCRETPRVAGGKIPVLLHLLSPARRPVQVTKDLAGFWSGTYKDVKRDLKGQYPKHVWPDDPLAALPTARAKPRGT